MEKEKGKLIKQLITIFWIFFIGSIVGYVFEIAFFFLKNGYFELRQGLVYGPFIPIYGVGAVLYYLVIDNLKIKNKLLIFFVTAVLGGITEYIFSFLQEKLFGSVSWDYSDLTFNLNGRTSLLHCTYWGLSGIFYIACIDPLVQKLKLIVDNKALRIITVILVIFMIFNILISWIASSRQLERKNDILPKNRFDVFLDKYYPDEFMDKIFNNKKYVV